MKLQFLFLYFLSWNTPWKIRRRLEIVGFPHYYSLHIKVFYCRYLV